MWIQDQIKLRKEKLIRHRQKQNFFITTQEKRPAGRKIKSHGAGHLIRETLPFLVYLKDNMNDAKSLP